MFDLVVMPLTEFWDDGGTPFSARLTTLGALQAAVAEQAGHEVSWAEEEPDNAEDGFEADSMEPYCLYGLRAVAAQLELGGPLEGFDLGDEPWDHPAISKLEDTQDGSQRFPQLLHGEAELVAYAPVTLDDVFMLQFDDDDSPEDEEHMAIGSAPKLLAELDLLGEALGMTQDADELPSDTIFDSDLDALAGAKYAWAVFRARTRQAIEAGLPLVLFFDAEDPDDEAETTH